MMMVLGKFSPVTIAFFMVCFFTTISGYNFVQLEINKSKLHVLKNEEQTVFHVEPFALTNPFYWFGCMYVRVNSNRSAFVLEAQYDVGEIGKEDGYWYRAVKLASRGLSMLRRKPNTNQHVHTRYLSPYRRTFLVINADENNVEFEITVKAQVLDMKCCMCLLLGVLLFYKAETLSKSKSFHYTGGTSIGVLASALILVYILSRFLPKKPAAYTVLLFGWSTCAWIVSKMWENVADILAHYHYYVIAYIILSGFISFAICYWYGGIVNPRSHKIFQWFIQLVSLFLIYNGTQLPELSIALIVIILGHKFILLLHDMNWFGNSSLKNLWIFKFLSRHGNPPPPKLLSDDEYRMQGEEETRRALEELRKFCRSPECSPWKTLSRIQTPKRFAQFVEGESHLLDDEVSRYEENVDFSTDSELEGDRVQLGDSLISEDDESLDPIKLDYSGDGSMLGDN